MCTVVSSMYHVWQWKQALTKYKTPCPTRYMSNVQRVAFLIWVSKMVSLAGPNIQFPSIRTENERMLLLFTCVCSIDHV